MFHLREMKQVVDASIDYHVLIIFHASHVSLHLPKYQSIGVGDSIDQAPFFFRILMATAMSKIFTDKNNQEAAIEASGLEFCIVRPGGLNVEAPTGIVNVIDGEAGSIARADVARFCLDAICMEDFPYLGQAPCISSVGGTSRLISMLFFFFSKQVYVFGLILILIFGDFFQVLDG